MKIEDMTFEQIMEHLALHYPIDDVINEAYCWEDNGQFSWEM
jgi:hypothetical protein